jgi:hypothetical protein
MYKEVVVAYFKVLSQNMPGGSEKKCENVIEVNLHPIQDSDWAASKYTAEAESHAAHSSVIASHMSIKLIFYVR